MKWRIFRFSQPFCSFIEVTQFSQRIWVKSSIMFAVFEDEAGQKQNIQSCTIDHYCLHNLLLLRQDSKLHYEEYDAVDVSNHGDERKTDQFRGRLEDENQLSLMFCVWIKSSTLPQPTLCWITSWSMMKYWACVWLCRSCDASPGCQWTGFRSKRCRRMCPEVLLRVWKSAPRSKSGKRCKVD